MDIANAQGEPSSSMDKTPSKIIGEVESSTPSSDKQNATPVPAVLVTSPSTNELEEDSEGSVGDRIDVAERNSDIDFASADSENITQESTAGEELIQNIEHDLIEAPEQSGQVDDGNGLVMTAPESSSPSMTSTAQSDLVESDENTQSYDKSKSEDYVVIGANSDAKLDSVTDSTVLELSDKSETCDRVDPGQSASGSVESVSVADTTTKESEAVIPEDDSKCNIEDEEAARNIENDKVVLPDGAKNMEDASEEFVAQDGSGDLIKEKVSTMSVDSEMQKPLENIATEETSQKPASDLSETELKQEETPEWLDILGNGLLKKKVLVQGKGRETRPVNGQEVTLRVKGKLKDGTEVDCHEELTFQLGDEDAIVAIELSVALMEDGEKAVVITDSKYAYGKFGRPNYEPPIPPSATLEYELELLSIREGKEIGSLTPEQQLKIGNEKRMKGNYLYVLGDYDAAISMYSRGVKYVEASSDKEVAELCTKIWNNLSAAQLKVQAFKAALNSCEMVLRAEPQNMKGYFRKGKCLEGLGDMEEALKCLKQASMLDPQNKLILQELGRVKAKVVNSQKKEREMYQRMMQGSGKSAEDREEDDSSGSWYPYVILAGVIAASSVVARWWWTRSH